MKITKNTPVYPGTPKVDIGKIATIENNGWNELRFCMSSHTATHIDAPYHMIESGKKLTDFKIDNFIGSATVLDARNRLVITVDVSHVKSGDIVFFCTNHSNTRKKDDYFTDYPILSQKTAEALVDKNVKMVGIDSYTFDHSPYPIHTYFFTHNILLVENLISLERLIQKRFRCYVLPLFIDNADGAPCRVIANV